MIERTMSIDTAAVDAEALGAGDESDGSAESDPVLEELLVEDVSIDGMCGVY